MNTAAPPTGLLLIVSGPSGVGKTTVARHVEKQLGGVFSVSMTTRPQTPNDTEGVDYHFVSREQFQHARDTGELLESAEVFGHCYGTPRRPVTDAIAAGRLVILEIDVQGAIQVKRQLPGARAIFVLPPSEPVLLSRLRHRSRESEQVIQRRFAKAKDEIARAKACGVYDTFIVNDDLASAQAQAVAWVQQQRGCPPAGRPGDSPDPQPASKNQHSPAHDPTA